MGVRLGLAHWAEAVSDKVNIKLYATKAGAARRPLRGKEAYVVKPREQWGIRAERSAASIFGPAEDWVKNDGAFALFECKEDAAAEAARLMAAAYSENLSYVAAQFYA